MANLTITDKLKLEKFLEMGGGYVLDFSNRTFEEFIRDSVSIDIYDEKYNYHSGSKANRLRAFWDKESNLIVGKLLIKLLEYWKTRKLLNGQSINSTEAQLFDECQKIAGKLNLEHEKTQKENEESLKRNQFISEKRNVLLQFEQMDMMGKDAKKSRERGFRLEKLLTDVLRLYEIPARRSFKRNEGAEQIDGAFELRGWYYLVECKWTEKLTDIRQLDSLYGKVNRSGQQTLGLFLSINGWSNFVASSLKQNTQKSIILMDGFDLRCVLDENYELDLKDLIFKKLEALNLEGEPFYSAKQVL